MPPYVLRPLVVLLAAVLCAAPTFLRADEVGDNRAVLVVRLPAGASLTIDGRVTAQTGAERQFLTPPLAPGKSYSYQVVVTWSEAGEARTLRREATITPGKRTVLELTAADAVAEKPTPATPKPEAPKVEAPKPDAPPAVPKPEEAITAPKKRTFQFTYGATVTGLKPGDKARIWLPVPSTSEDQEIKVESPLPEGGKIGTEAQYKNQILSVEGTANADGKIPLAMTYQVTRHELKGDRDSRMEEDMALMARLLQADALVPLGGKPQTLLAGKDVPKDQLAAAKVFYDLVDSHMKYSKDGQGWGRGDAEWACDSKFGNCSDFHSLFISLARSHQIPAKFEIGFPIPTKRGEGDVAGYHCWAKFRPEGKGWMPVDISEANKNPSMKEYYFGNLTEDRVTFSVGRDLQLVPKQEGGPVNFLVYPYVEVDGKPYPADKVQRKFGYRDVP